MRTIASLALAATTFIAAAFGLAQPAAAQDGAFLGVQLGPIGLGFDVDDDDYYDRHDWRYDDDDDDDDWYGTYYGRDDDDWYGRRHYDYRYYNRNRFDWDDDEDDDD